MIQDGPASLQAGNPFVRMAVSDVVLLGIRNAPNPNKSAKPASPIMAPGQSRFRNKNKQVIYLETPRSKQAQRKDEFQMHVRVQAYQPKHAWRVRSPGHRKKQRPVNVKYKPELVTCPASKNAATAQPIMMNAAMRQFTRSTQSGAVNVPAKYPRPAHSDKDPS